MKTQQIPYTTVVSWEPIREPAGRVRGRVRPMQEPRTDEIPTKGHGSRCLQNHKGALSVSATVSRLLGLCFCRFLSSFSCVIVFLSFTSVSVSLASYCCLSVSSVSISSSPPLLFLLKVKMWKLRDRVQMEEERKKHVYGERKGKKIRSYIIGNEKSHENLVSAYILLKCHLMCDV